MELNTASEVISLAKKLEEDGAKLYEDLAQRYIKDRETWLSFAKENRRNVIQIERAYYEVITDAIEGCFSFKINPDEYMLKTKLAENASYSDALNKAARMEEKIIKFYSDAAEQSKSLLADVPRVFMMVARKRDDRRAKLGSLLTKEG
ncbi:hypothetical protein ACFLTR_04600 [Chloroflexota bacterium]